MSRKLFAFLLSELKTVRIICKYKDCGAVSEISVEQLHKTASVVSCHLCGGRFTDPTMPGPLSALGSVLAKCRVHSEAFDVEFVLPDDGRAG